ncbi:MAG: class I SAM-dependent methyltransferase [Thermoplasmata archaeon]
MTLQGAIREITCGSPLKSLMTRARWGPMWHTAGGLLGARGETARFLGVRRSEVSGWLRELRGHPNPAEESRLRFRQTVGRDPNDRVRVLGPINEMLYLMIRASRPEIVVETGVHYGFSSSYLLRALHDNGRGRMTSIDLPTTDPHGRVNAEGRIDMSTVGSIAEIGCAVPDRLRDRWELILGPSEEHLPKLLQSLPPVDVFFHDSDHSRSVMLREYRTAWPTIRPGGLLLSDDVDWNDAFVTFQAEMGGTPFKWFGSEGKRGALRRPASSTP